MSRLLEFLLGSLLIPVFTVAFIFFSSLHYILKTGSAADCIWQASARAWFDSNGDGRVNAGEPPLSNIRIHVDDLQNQLVDAGWSAVTDEDGEAQLNLLVPECADTPFEIYVDVPDGYRLTTSPRIEAHSNFLESLTGKPVYHFGFAAAR